MGKPKRKPSAYNKCMSRELKGKMSGKTKAQRAALFKAAAKRCSGKSPKRASKLTIKRGSTRRVSVRRTPTGGKITMGRKGGFNTQKLFKILRLGALALPAAGIAMQPISTNAKIQAASMAYFGVNPGDGSFELGRLAKGWYPYLASIAVTYGIPKIAGLLRGL